MEETKPHNKPPKRKIGKVEFLEGNRGWGRILVPPTGDDKDVLQEDREYHFILANRSVTEKDRDVGGKPVRFCKVEFTPAPPEGKGQLKEAIDWIILERPRSESTTPPKEAKAHPATKSGGRETRTPPSTAKKPSKEEPEGAMA
jgi:hypothetical protein